MCGLCGELRFDGQVANSQLIQTMSAKLERRGPDDNGIFSEGPVALGHRRLAIIDLSSESHQPMHIPELGLSIVFNGSIYNYPDLRKQLQAMGHQFFSHGDTEVILRAYAEWGDDFVKRLHGMFAFAIWDRPKQHLLMARDRMGIKPLYYSLNNKRLRFASTPQALLAGKDIDTAVDPVGLHHQLTLHAVIPAPHTILRGIRKLKPAHTVKVAVDGTLTEQRYWTLKATRPTQSMSESDWITATHDTLKRAVKKRLEVADVPVGVLLSGGLDSSLLVGLLAEAGVTGLRTFTVGFEDQPEEKGNEYEYSDPVAERFCTEHAKFHIANEELIDRLPDAIGAMSEPMVAQDAVAFYLLAEQVSKEIKVVQSGQGADEVFGGYFWYPQMQAESSGSKLERFRKHYFDRSHQEWLDAIEPAFHTEDITSQRVAQLLNEPAADEFIDRVLHMDVTTLIVDDPVKRVDNMTMAWGLEARVPFLDHELVELAASMPPELKLRQGGKYPLKAIARGLLPDKVIDREKGYFPVPALKFVRGRFLDMMQDTLHSAACRQRGLFNQRYIETLLQAPEQHMTALKGSKLWHLALLEMWLQMHVDTG